MQHSRHHFLAGAGLAGEKDGGVHAGDALHPIERIAQGRRAADDGVVVGGVYGISIWTCIIEPGHRVHKKSSRAFRK
jgi:hypothetical protein